MHWNRKTARWESFSGKRKANMSLFRKKDKEDFVSAFDHIPRESQDKLIEDVISIARLIKGWKDLVPPELYKGMTDEVGQFFRTAGLKLVGSVAMGGDLDEIDFDKLLKGVKPPLFFLQLFHGVKLALSDQLQVRSTTTNPMPDRIGSTTTREGADDGQETK